MRLTIVYLILWLGKDSCKDKWDWVEGALSTQVLTSY